MTRNASFGDQHSQRVTPSPRFRVSPVVSGAVAFAAPEPATLAASPRKTRHPSVHGLPGYGHHLPFQKINAGISGTLDPYRQKQIGRCYMNS